ncbi:MAG: helicase-associated domain-containing protein [Propionibacteriaceae bacterium]|nr:helicase-associated domain-containing protein [Propionibacteriaceae bacterium]
MRVLADALSGFDEPALSALLRERPDLCVPAPADLSDLAARATAPASVRRALDALTAPELATAEAIAALPDPDAEAVGAWLGFDPGPALGRLAGLALVWPRTPSAGTLDHCLEHAFAPFPGGLADPSPEPLTTAAIEAALTGLPEAALGVLHKLTWGPPTGSVRNADRIVTEPATPIEHLLTRGLLRAHDPNTVILPREVALHLRGGFLREPLPEPPAPTPGPRAARIIDSAAVGAAFEFVHQLEGLLDELTRRTPAPLRTGGLASRDLTALARAVDAPVDKASFALEVAYAAGLVTPTGPAVVATEAFDRWLGSGSAARYAQVLRDWVGAPRWAAAARAEGGRALLPDQDAGWAPQARRAILDRLGPGDAIDADRLSAWTAWHRPALARSTDPAALVAAVLAEAEWLGLTALGQASALVTALSGELAPETAALFPELVDHLILQGDLTAVATGPLDRPTAAALALMADVESRGGGGVFRFSASSVRRAFDAGWNSSDLEDWLTAHSRTGVPQPLRYLVGDVARRHGTVRVGAARSYVRIDDPARLSTVLAHPGAEELGLRQVGPETLIAAADPAEIVTLLRSVGLTPGAENAAGELLATPAPRRPPAPARTRRTPPDIPRNTAALHARRAARRTAELTEETLTVLTLAARESRQVEVDYVAADGTRTRSVAVPVELADGMVRLAGGGVQVSLPLGRVTAARSLTDSPD